MNFTYSIYIQAALGIYLESSSVMALALPGQCVTEAILFKNVFTKTNLNLQFGKKWPYGGRAARTIWKIICAIKANTDKPNKAFWKWLVEATAVKMNNKQNNINNTCIMENDNLHHAQVAKICPLMQEHFLSPLLKRKALLTAKQGFKVVQFSPKEPSGSE